MTYDEALTQLKNGRSFQFRLGTQTTYTPFLVNGNDIEMIANDQGITKRCRVPLGYCIENLVNGWFVFK